MPFAIVGVAAFLAILGTLYLAFQAHSSERYYVREVRTVTRNRNGKSPL